MTVAPGQGCDRRILWGGLHGLWALGWGVLALWGAAAHPVAPAALLAVLWALGVWVAWRPQVWPVLVLACLPVADFTPWTGWWLWSEFDLLLCAVVAGAHSRWAWDVSCAQTAPGAWAAEARVWGWWSAAVAVVFLALWCVGTVRAWWDAGAPAALFEPGYDQIGNTWRVGKSVLALCVLLPLLWRSVCTEGPQLLRRVVVGVLVGLAVVCVLVVCERFLYAGGLDVTRSYRTSAWFWEMHVGGGAIDAYLAMAAPFAVWVVWVAPTPARWMGAALLLFFTVFGLLTTFSRGVYLVGLGTCLLLWATAALLRWRPVPQAVWRTRAMRGLWVVLVLEAGGVLAWSTFMADRLDDTEEAAYQRLAHWQNGIALVDTPARARLGLGQGRLPSHYSQRVEGGGFPGQARLQTTPRPGVALSGPAPDTPVEAFVFGLTQKVDLKPGGRYQLRVRVVTTDAVHLMARVCERHLLYDLACQWRRFQVPATGADAVERTVVLRGPAFAPDNRLAGRRSGMLAVSVLNDGATVQIERLELTDPHGVQVLRNTGFEQGWAHWMPAAQGHFLPWHMDNLYLEIWAERGWLGVGVLGAVLLVGLGGVVSGLRRRNPWAMAWWLCMASTLVLGVVISFMEMPRVAFMLLLLFFIAPLTRFAGETAATCNINSISPRYSRAGQRA